MRECTDTVEEVGQIAGKVGQADGSGACVQQSWLRILSSPLSSFDNLLYGSYPRHWTTLLPKALSKIL